MRNLSYTGEVVHVLEVEDDGEAEGGEVGGAGVVHEVLAGEEAGLADENDDVVEPEHAPEDLGHVEGVVEEPLEGAVEVRLGHPIDLQRDEVVLPNDGQY